MGDNAGGDAEERVGVGPHPRPWPEDPRLDPELLAHGDSRNVADRFRYWSVEAIVAELDRDPFALEVAIEHWSHSFNIGTVVRNANAFGARRVHIVGRRRWNRRGAMVTDRYLHVEHHDHLDTFQAHAREHRLTIVALDNVDGAEPLDARPLPERTLLLCGAEGPGLTDDALAVADESRCIPMFGSTRSINAGVASGIALHAWTRHHARPLAEQMTEQEHR